MTNHPTHPATVHFPIAFTLLASFLDTLYFLSTLSTPGSPNALLSTVYSALSLQSLPPTLLPLLSYHTTRLAILSALPAVVTGIIELRPLVQRDGLNSPKAQTGVKHAMINNVNLMGMVWNWWSRRGVSGFRPSGANLFVSVALAVPGVFAGAYLGGQLVYQYGMGIGRGSSAAVKPTPKKE